MVNINKLLTDIQKYQKYKKKFKLEDTASFVGSLDGLILKFNEMMTVCEKQGIDVEQDFISDSDLVKSLNEQLVMFFEQQSKENRSVNFFKSICKSFIQKLFNLTSRIRDWFNHLSNINQDRLVSCAAIFVPIILFLYMISEEKRNKRFDILCYNGLLFTWIVIVLSHIVFFNYFSVLYNFTLPSNFILNFIVVAPFIALAGADFIVLLLFPLFFQAGIIHDMRDIKKQCLTSFLLFKRLPLKSKLKYCFNLFGMISRQNELSFFEQYLSVQDINSIGQYVDDKDYCKDVIQTVRPYIIVSHIHSRDEANELLNKVEELKKKQLNDLEEFLTVK